MEPLPAGPSLYRRLERGMVIKRSSCGRLTEGFYDTAFSLKAISVATQTSLPKNFHVAKEAVSAA